VDRVVLLRNAATRLLGEALSSTVQRVAELRSEAAMAGRSRSGWLLETIGDVHLRSYRDGCIAVLDKIQLEDRDGALEIAEDFRNSLLEPAVQTFANASMESTVGKRPAPDAKVQLNSTASAWHRHHTEMVRRLRDVQANVVEEFQLALTRQLPRKLQQVHSGTFVDRERIEALRAKTSVAWDFSRLIGLCEEINTCWQYGAHHAVAMLTRAIIDHVPPVLGQKTFAAVAANYGGPRSFKESMAGLDQLSRKISDSHLHTPIRDREVLPNANQVDFKAGLDVLLAEIIRITP